MKTTNKTLLSLMVAAGIGMTSGAALAEKPYAEHDKASVDTQAVSAEFHNGWLEGKLETAYLFNENLNNFTIDSEVHGDKAILNGKVSSAIDKDLAEEIALSVDGIKTVENNLTVDPKSKDDVNDDNDGFLADIGDATITAKVKMKLLVNENTSGMDIEIHTEDNVVTLQGEVSSDAEKDLAGAIAGNVESVKDVKNMLTVMPS